MNIAGLGIRRGHRLRRSSGIRFKNPNLRQYLTMGACALLIVATFYALTRPSANPVVLGAADPAGTVTQTRWGPLDANDRLLLTKVRQAGLWEMPTGQQAQSQGKSEKVREAGRKIAAEHSVLDKDVRTVAAQLGVPLPSVPNADQQGWMKELLGKTGNDFDVDFVKRLRAAHGKVFTIIAQVRSNTRNTLIQEFAQRCMAFVNRHMGYLEATGLVNYSTLYNK